MKRTGKWHMVTTGPYLASFVLFHYLFNNMMNTISPLPSSTLDVINNVYLRAPYFLFTTLNIGMIILFSLKKFRHKYMYVETI